MFVHEQNNWKLVHLDSEVYVIQWSCSWDRPSANIWYPETAYADRRIWLWAPRFNRFVAAPTLAHYTGLHELYFDVSYGVQSSFSLSFLGLCRAFMRLNKNCQRSGRIWSVWILFQDQINWNANAPLVYVLFRISELPKIAKQNGSVRMQQVRHLHHNLIFDSVYRKCNTIE